MQRFQVQSTRPLVLINVRFDPPEGGWVFPATVDVDKLPKIGLGVGKPGEADGEKLFYIFPKDLAYAPAAPG
jgi:hypothetical protein